MYKRGFTLIELIVVFAIISLLSSVVIASINSAREKARDSQRIADLAQIRTALELYYSANGQYPLPPGCTYGETCYVMSHQPEWNTFATSLSAHIPSLPRDPRGGAGAPWTGGTNYNYSYGNVTNTGTAHQYDLTALLESATHPQRCAVRMYPYGFPTPPTYGQKYWCGTGGWSMGTAGRVYEASPN